MHVSTGNNRNRLTRSNTRHARRQPTNYSTRMQHSINRHATKIRIDDQQ